IRDWSVTGVQTCALPICAVSLDHFRHDEIVAFARRRVLENGFRVTAVANDVGALLHGHRRHRGHRLDARYVDFTELLDESQNREIGRASCRERGERWAAE